MEIVKVDEGGLSGEQKNLVKKMLCDGAVVMHATETCYGFTCDFFQPAAWQRLFDVKRIPKSKPVSIMVRDVHEARKYGVFSHKAEQLVKEFWPGPLTIIVPRTPELPDYVNPGDETVGIRCPDFPLAQSLIELNGRPLCTTSANIAGEPESYRVEDYLGQIEVLKGRGIEVVVADIILDSGEIAAHPPSTIVRLAGGKTEIIRQGSLSEEVNAFLAKHI